MGARDIPGARFLRGGFWRRDVVYFFPIKRKAQFNVQTMEMIQGDLPRKAQALVCEWLCMHQAELQQMWDEQKIQKLPPLE